MDYLCRDGEYLQESDLDQVKARALTFVFAVRGPPYMTSAVGGGGGVSPKADKRNKIS